MEAETEVKGKGKCFAVGQVQERERLAGTAGAAAPEHRGRAVVLCFAALGQGVLVLLLKFQLLLAAAGVVGALFGRAAADIAIAGALSGHRMGEMAVAKRQGRKGAQGDVEVDHHEQQSVKKSWCSASGCIHL
jgi:hypothetical protein